MAFLLDSKSGISRRIKSAMLRERRGMAGKRERRPGAALALLPWLAAGVLALVCAGTGGRFVTGGAAPEGEGRVAKDGPLAEAEALEGGEQAAWIGPQPTADMEEIEAVRPQAARCTLRLSVSGEGEYWYGTAVIWDQTGEEIIAATSAHLFDQGGERILVDFPVEDAGTAEGKLLGSDQARDVAFVSFRKDALDREALSQLCYVRLHQRTYDTLAQGDRCFALGSAQDSVATLFCPLVLSQKDYEAQQVGEGLFLFEGSARAGMSGSGAYDGYGNFIGLVVAASGDYTAAVPMADVNEAYRQICGRARDTREYGE